MIQNKIDEIMTKKGLKPGWVVEKFNEVSGLDLSEMSLYNIRKQKRQPSATELFWFEKVLEIEIKNMIFDV